MSQALTPTDVMRCKDDEINRLRLEVMRLGGIEEASRAVCIAAAPWLGHFQVGLDAALASLLVALSHPSEPEPPNSGAGQSPSDTNPQDPTP